VSEINLTALFIQIYLLYLNWSKDNFLLFNVYSMIEKTVFQSGKKAEDLIYLGVDNQALN